MSDKHKLEELIDNLVARDRDTLDEMNRVFGGGMINIENRLELVNGRAVDALIAIAILARYIIDKERNATAARQGE